MDAAVAREFLKSLFTSWTPLREPLPGTYAERRAAKALRGLAWAAAAVAGLACALWAVGVFYFAVVLATLGLVFELDLEVLFYTLVYLVLPAFVASVVWTNFTVRPLAAAYAALGEGRWPPRAALLGTGAGAFALGLAFPLAFLWALTAGLVGDGAYVLGVTFMGACVSPLLLRSGWRLLRP